MNRPLTLAGARQRSYRERHKAGLRSFWLAIDIAAARRRFPDAVDDDDLRCRLEEMIDDALM